MPNYPLHTVLASIYLHNSDSPALLIRMSSRSSVAMYSLANCLTEYREARSKCRTTTFPFPVDKRMSAAAFCPRVRSRHAITTRAPKTCEYLPKQGTAVNIIGYCKTLCGIFYTLPLRAMSFAVSFPIPVLAPVINTVFPSRRVWLEQTPPAIHFLNRNMPGSVANESLQNLV